MNWIKVTDSLPNEVFAKELQAKYPEITYEYSEYDCVLFDCLAVFADVDKGKVEDVEIGHVQFCKRDGWLYPSTGQNISKSSIKVLTHWCMFPDSPKCSEVQAALDEKNSILIK
jgi:hypothetical protein